MSREDPHFRLRFPNDLREKVEAAARENKRSMTAEIIARLEASFAPALTHEQALTQLQPLLEALLDSTRKSRGEETILGRGRDKKE